MDAPSELPAMPPLQSYPVAQPKKKHRKQIIYGTFLILVLILVYVVMKQKAYIDKGFSVNGIPDGTKIPTPCKAADHAKVLSASYKDTNNAVTDVAAKLQAAYTAQAGNAPYTVSSASLLPSGKATPGGLTFRAKCPQGRVM